ncbi:MAG TPA: flagellar hook-length control protein FliK, partial [Phenylobacterium sp.]
VAPVAETDAAPEGKVSTETAPATPTKEAKSEAIDTPDFQPSAPAASAQANAAAPHAPQVRATSETVANLTAAISKKLEGRSTKFDIELTPAGLGHVSVSVEIAASGKMSAAMSFDSPQAAAELRSRSHELHKALEQAGFDVAGGLTFDVNGDRGEGGRNLAQQQQQNDGAAWRGRAFQAVLGTAGEAAETAASAALHYSRRSDAGVDIRI